MKFLFLTFLITALVLVPIIKGTPAEDGSAFDHFVGWYHLPAVDRKTRQPIKGEGSYFPVMRRGEKLVTLMKWFEAPLLQSDGVLKWDDEEPPHQGMDGTAILRDSKTGDYFLIHCDAQQQMHDQHYVWGEKRKLQRVDRPAWIPSHKTPMPQKLEDWIGTYYVAWLPVMRFEITKEDGKYWMESYTQSPEGKWERDSAEKKSELKPNKDGTGFQAADQPLKKLVFNRQLSRLEMRLGEEFVMPLVTESNLLEAEDFVREKWKAIGIPCW